MSAVENGWLEVDGRYDYDWYEGSQLPNFISDVIIQPDVTNTDDESEMSENATEEVDEIPGTPDVSDDDEENEYYSDDDIAQ